MSDPSDLTFGRRVRLIVTLVCALYCLSLVIWPGEWHFIDGVNLLIHEGGHVVFSPFGEFISIAGGSMMQVIMPAAFVGYFWYRGEYFSAALLGCWVGESLLNVSIYAGDAVNMGLPLLGNGDRIHDWNYMLSHLGLLGSTNLIATLIRFSAYAIITAATVLAGVVAWRWQPS